MPSAVRERNLVENWWRSHYRPILDPLGTFSLPKKEVTKCEMCDSMLWLKNWNRITWPIWDWVCVLDRLLGRECLGIELEVPKLGKCFRKAIFQWNTTTNRFLCQQTKPRQMQFITRCVVTRDVTVISKIVRTIEAYKIPLNDEIWRDVGEWYHGFVSESKAFWITGNGAEQRRQMVPGWT